MTTFSEQFPIVFQALNVGFLQTLKLFAITLIGAIPLGLIIAFGSMSNWSAFGFLRPVVLKHVNLRELSWWQKVQVWFVTDFKPVRLLTRLVIWVVRGTPLMLQLMFIFFAPYYIFGVQLSMDWKFGACAVAFIMNYSAYFAEIYRSGIQSIPRGQYEAAEILGYSKAQTFLRIIFPQVFKRIVPALGNEVIVLVKDTSLAFTIGVAKSLHKSQGFTTF